MNLSQIFFHAKKGIKPVDRTFRKFGDIFQQVKRHEMYCIYKRFNQKGLNVYETVKLSIYKDRVSKYNPHGNNTLKEKYPSSELFGISGWYFDNYNDALAKFNALTGGIKND